MIQVIQTNDEKHGQFEAFYSEKHAGLMTYTWAGNDKFIIDHTEVNSNFAGQSVGKKLVMKAAKYAKENR